MAAATLALAIGCGPSPLAQGSAALLLGSGSPRFLPIVDGDEVDIIHGPQGGYHIWGSLLSRGLGERLSLRFTLTRLDDGFVANIVDTSALVMPLGEELLLLDGGHAGLDGGAFEFALPPGEGTWGIAPGALVFVPDPAELKGRRVRMQVRAEGDVGLALEDSRWFIARQP